MAEAVQKQDFYYFNDDSINCRDSVVFKARSADISSRAWTSLDLQIYPDSLLLKKGAGRISLLTVIVMKRKMSLTRLDVKRGAVILEASGIFKKIFAR